jgi:hypothetical protein
MLDLSKLTDTVFLGGGAVQDLLPNNDLAAAITGSGLGLEDLQGLDADQLIGLLHSQGIDVSALAPEQLQPLIEAVANGNLADIWDRS